MKKLIFLCSFVFLASMVSAQKCSKSKKCCAKKSKATSSITEVGNATSDVSFAFAEVDKMVETDEALEKRVCEKTGTSAYYKKNVCSVSGKESWVEVEYCTKSKAFKELSAVDMKEEMAAPATEEAEEGGM